MTAEGDVKVAGTSVSRKHLIIGGVITGGLLIIYEMRKSTAASMTPAAAPASPAYSAAAGSAYPWDGSYGVTSDPYSMDPSSGVTYGSEGSAGVSGPSGTSGPPFSTNSEWSNYVIGQMTANNPGQDVATLTDALGVYLAGQPASATQRTLIFDAIAVAGDPPVAGPNGYPPKIQGDGSTGPGTPTPTPAPTPTPTPVPTYTSKPGMTGGLRASVTATAATLDWNPVPQTAKYHVRGWFGSPVQIAFDRWVTGTRLNVSGLRSRTTYGWHVEATNPDGGGPWSDNAHFTTS